MNVFIHGYGTNISSPAQKLLGKEKGLYGIDSSDFTAFDWSLPFNLGFFAQIDPRITASIYNEERKRTRDPKIHEDLSRFLAIHSPQILLAHSLGCELVLQHSHDYQFPSSVRRIIWMQADVGYLEEIQLPSGVELINIFCPWDPAMVIGTLYHRIIRAGLIGHRDTHTKNILLPATDIANLHTSCLRDVRLREYLE